MPLSTRIFRLLLRVFPTEFRLEYGRQLEQVFRQDYETETRRRGLRGVVRLWRETIADVARNAPREHLSDLAPEVRYAGRMLSRQAGFTLLVVAILALGIGTTAAVFSVVNTVALRRLPFPKPEQLVTLWETSPQESKTGVSSALAAEFASASQSFSEMAAVSPRNLLLRGYAADSAQVSSQSVTEKFFRMLGTAAARGRVFLPSDYAASSPPVVVLSDALWTRRFGRDPAIVGSTISLNDRPYLVVGVMRREFDFPSFYGQVLNPADVWLPLQLSDSLDRTRRWFRPIARLRDGVPIQQARAELRGIASRFAAAHPDTNAGFSADIQTLEEQLLGDIRPLLVLLFGASVIVLLIALVNVINLLLVNAVRRERELALRTALGAGVARLTRQLIVEGLFLSLFGAGVGLAIASALIRMITAVVPSVYPVPRLASVVIDQATILYTLAIAAVAGVVFGLLPSAIARRSAIAEVLKEGSRGSGGSRTRRAREVLVVCQIALSLVLLTGAGVLVKSLVLLQQVSPGFRPGDVLTLNVRFSPEKYSDSTARVALLRDLLQRVESVPGVRSAALTHSLPMRWPPAGADVIAEGKSEVDVRDVQHVGYRVVSPRFLGTMGIPLVSGRDFTERDGADAPGVAIISQSMARRLWPDSSPIGRRLRRVSADQWFVVVGVFADVKQVNLAAAPMPEMFLCYLQDPPRADSAMAILLEPGVQRVEASIREAILARDRELAILETKPMRQIVADSLWRQRFSLALMSGFGCVALALAAVGIFGVMSHVVMQRQQEFGIRISLGAAPSSVLRLVFQRGLILTLLGLGAGGAVIGSTGRAGAEFLKAQGLLFGTGIHDLTTMLLVGLLLVLVSLAASFWPAWKATQVDPVRVLRSQ